MQFTHPKQSWRKYTPRLGQAMLVRCDKNAVFYLGRVRCAHHTPALPSKRCAQRTLPIASLKLNRTFNRTHVGMQDNYKCLLAKISGFLKC